ncbi:MAG: ribonuclease P protein component [Patescibacteria group bacterium]
MDKKLESLTKKRDLITLRKYGRTVSTSRLSLKSARLKNDERILITVVVSQRVSKKAVERNKVKRRLRAVFVKYRDKVKNGMVIMIIARPISRQASYTELKNDLEYLINKACLLI